MTYPETKAIQVWERDGLKFSVVQNHALCGYVRFPTRPVAEDGYHGILDYVPVHGGITYAHEDAEGMVYGFDCGHADDDEDPRMQDVSWVKGEAERLGMAIREAAKIESDYLRNDGNNDARAAILDEYRARMTASGCDEGFNMGVSLRLLSGRL